MTVDHVAESLATLPSSLQDLPGWTTAVTVLTRPCQRLEDTIAAVLVQRYIQYARGAQLDMIGGIVDQPRNGVTDDDLYRRYLFARIAANRSSGTGEEVIKISVLVINDEGARHVVRNLETAAMILTVEDVETPDNIADILISILREAVLAGVRIVLVTLADTGANTFRCADPCTFLAGAHLAGAVTLDVDSTDGYPNAGGLVINWGATANELVGYSGKTATTFTGIVPFVGGPGLNNNQPDRAAVQVFAFSATEHPGFALATFTSGDHLAGVTTLTVDDTTDFPVPGTIRVDVGTVTEEELSYTGTTGTDFTGVDSVASPGGGTVYAHADRGAVVCPIPGTDAVNEPYAGGVLAGAVI